MYNTRRLIAGAMVVALSVLVAMPASANHFGTYLAVERTAVFVDNGFGARSSDSRFDGVRFKLGTRISRYLDVEAQFGGADENTSKGRFDGLDARFGGLYLRGRLPIGRRTALFGLGGVSWIDLSDTFIDDELDTTFSGASFGFGIETQIAPYVGVTADFITFGQTDDVFDGLSAVNFGVKVQF